MNTQRACRIGLEPRLERSSDAITHLRVAGSRIFAQRLEPRHRPEVPQPGDRHGVAAAHAQRSQGLHRLACVFAQALLQGETGQPARVIAQVGARRFVVFGVRGCTAERGRAQSHTRAVGQAGLHALPGHFGHFHHTAYNIASAYALLGEPAQAIHWLQDAADNGFPCYPLFAADTQLEALRRDPRFIAFLATMRRDWEQRQKSL